MIALHPDVGEGAEPAGSSLQAGFFMSEVSRWTRMACPYTGIP